MPAKMANAYNMGSVRAAFDIKRSKATLVVAIFATKSASFALAQKCDRRHISPCLSGILSQTFKPGLCAGLFLSGEDQARRAFFARQKLARRAFFVR